MSGGLLQDKTILLGITGSIAAYKTVDWARSLRREGATVRVVMTPAATRFVSPLSLAALTANPVYSEMFEARDAHLIPHISLARECDLILVAPATAQTIARLAHGLADDLLSTVILAAQVPVIVCPAMNSRMLLHPATQDNLARIRHWGYRVVEPACGSMACGEEGPGKLPEWDQVRDELLAELAPRSLEGRRVVVSAGPTREHVDPARFISNRSTGKMGYAMARTARRLGARVTLVSGPTQLTPPHGVELVAVESAADMHQALSGLYEQADVIVMAAAVADHRPVRAAVHKLKKASLGETLALEPTVDILQDLGARKKSSGHGPLLVGFAAESRDLESEGLRKLRQKNLDLIVVNDIGRRDTGFAVDTNQVTLLDASEGKRELPLLSKEETAGRIWKAVVSLLTD